MVPARLASLFRRRRIETADQLAAFACDQAMHVAQVSLLNYLRARMGTSWPRHFQDPAFAPSIAQAQQAGYRMCLGDLVVFVTIELGAGQTVAQRLLSLAGEDTGDHRPRLAGADWQDADRAFLPSLSGLIAVAPVAQAFRDEDGTAFANALALRWAEVRRRFRAQADLPALRRSVA